MFPGPTELRLIGCSIDLDSKIQIKCIDTKTQLADILTKGNFTCDELESSFVFVSISAISVLQIVLKQWRNDLFQFYRLCLGRIHQHPQSNQAWKDRIGWIITEESYRDYDGISGEQTEFEWNIFPGFTTLQLYGKVTNLLKANPTCEIHEGYCASR